MTAILSRLMLDPALRKLRYRCALAFYGLIVVMGAIPGARAQIGHYATGIVLHTLAYAIVTVLLFTGSGGSAARRATMSVLTVMAMGAVDETVQSFLPYRNGALADWMIDCNASIVASALLWVLWSRRGLPE